MYTNLHLNNYQRIQLGNPHQFTEDLEKVEDFIFKNQKKIKFKIVLLEFLIFILKTRKRFFIQDIKKKMKIFIKF